MQNNIMTTLRAALILIAAVSLLSGCKTFGGVSINWPPDGPPPHHDPPAHKEEKGPPPHAPAHGYRAKHMYHYYPKVEVYYDVERRLYFHFADDSWHVGASLPSHYGQLSAHVNIEVEGDKPYIHHAAHKKKYPPGQYKKKNKSKKKKKWD